MKKFIVNTFLLALMITISLSSNSQNNYVDSLKKVLQTGKEDTSRVLALVEMSWETKDNKTSMQYAAQGLALANKLNYNKGKARAYNRIGRINYELHNDSFALKNYFIAANIRKQMNEEDNLWGVLLNIGDVYIRENNLTAAKKYYDEGLEIVKKYATVDQLLDAYFQTSISYNRVHYYAEAISNMENVVEFYRKANNKGATAGAYSFLATIYTGQYNYPKAIQNFNNGLKLYNEIGDKKDAANMLQYIGNWYGTMGNDSDAIKYQLASVKMRGQVDDKAGMAMSYVTMSQMYSHKGRYNEAFKEINEALKLYQQPGTPNWGEPMCFLMIGGLYENLGDSAAAKDDKATAVIKYSAAENYYAKALQKNKENSTGQSGEGYSALGAIYIKLKNLPLAKAYLDSALKISLEFDNKRLLKDCYQNLATLDSLQGNYSQAYFHHIKYISYRDSLNNEENAKKLVQIKMQTEFDQKQEILKAEQGKKDAETKRVRNQQFFIILSLGVVVLAVIVIALIQFRNNKQKQQANLALQKQKEKVESTLSELKSTQAQLIQSEKMASLGELTAGIAHEIQNPLNFVNNFSEVNKEMIDEAKEEINKGNYDDAKIILSDIQDNSQKINHHGKRADAIVKGMLQHSRKSEGKKELTDINVLCDEYLRLAYHGFRAKDKAFNAEIKTDFDESVGTINIIRQDIGRALLNLFNNAFYAVNERLRQAQPDSSYRPFVTVTTQNSFSAGGEGRGEVLIIISDNGNGIPQNIVDKIFQPFFTTKPTGQGTGLGLSLAYDIIKTHNGEIKVETKEGDGSIFIITLPNV